MGRESRLTPLLPVAAAFLLAACGGTESPQAPAATAREDTPVVLYLIDTLRADRLGLYGYGKPTSPVIDALARESVVFDAAYAPAPWTLPSVASIVTSRWPCEHGLVEFNKRLNAALPTLAERLQTLGHATGGYYQNTIVGPLAGLDRGLQISELRAESTRSLLPEAGEFLDQVRDGPFYLYLHTMEPHNIEQVPPAFLKEMGHVSIDDREAFTAHWDRLSAALHGERKAGQEASRASEEDAALAMTRLTELGDAITRLYDAAVRQADSNLGEVVDLMKQRGLWDRVIFVVVADHGEAFGDHGTWFHEHSVYEEIIRVPMLVHFPKGEFGGRRVAERVSLLDVMPTILDYLGQGASCEGCRGRSLLPLLASPGAAGQPAEVAAVRINRTAYFRPAWELRGDVNVAIRDGAWKGIWNQEVERLELYDLASDPGERSDLGADPAQRERAARLRSRADGWLGECQAQLVPPVEVAESDIDETTRERLRALGYLR